MGSKATKLRKKARAARKSPEPMVNPFAAAHGQYESGTVVDLSGELGGKRMSMVKVLVNRGGSAVDRWMANDPLELFGPPQRNAISLCRQLWHRAEGLSSLDLAADRIDFSRADGWSQQEALDALSGFKKRIPPAYWAVFENVVRFDEEAGVAGSRLATNSRSAIDAAKTTVAFCAGLIAMWERL